MNQTRVEVCAAFFNDAVSFVPCFTYADSEDAVLLASRHITYHVDGGGQHHVDYYGMKHEVVETSVFHTGMKHEVDECFVDLNDEHAFQTSHLNDLVTESKVTFYHPDYVLQVPSRQHLINLLDLSGAFTERFILHLGAISAKKGQCETRLQVPGRQSDQNFRSLAGGHPVCAWKFVESRVRRPFLEAVPRPRPVPRRVAGRIVDAYATSSSSITETDRSCRDRSNEFLRKIIEAKECFHFRRSARHGRGARRSFNLRRRRRRDAVDVASAVSRRRRSAQGKTKVILPLFCMAFLSSNKAVRDALARGGREKRCLVV